MTTRRDFLALLSGAVLAGQRERRVAVAIGMITSRNTPFPEAEAGVRFGLREMERSASLVDGRLAVEPFVLEERASWRIRPGPAAFVSALDGPGTVALADAELNGPCFNITARDDALRGPDCAAGLFHIEASESMYRDAARLGGRPAVLWDPGLTRYGAGQLNDRFRAATGTAMGASEWAGWLAIKIIWEASVRVAQGEGMTGWLTSESAGFDGHKGERLSFRSWDGQLRQPLFVPARAGTHPTEPVPDAAQEAGLDAIGVPRRSTLCHRGRP